MKSLCLLRLVFLLGMLGFGFCGFGQVNLVQNPSFEIYDTCPNTFSQIRYAKYWSYLVNHSGGTPDFLHTCSEPNNYVGAPDNGFGYQYARTGDGYAALGLFSDQVIPPNYSSSEYMNNRLRDTLIAGKSYCVKMYVSLAEKMCCGIDGFGFYFDDGTAEPIPTGSILNVTPQVENPSFNIIMDSVGWVEVSGVFQATGNESYVTIGNFRDNVQTHYLPVAGHAQPPTLLAYFYIDDVSVIEMVTAFAGNDTALVNVGDSLFLGRPEEAELALACTWYTWAGDTIGTGSGIWVTPSHTQPYIVEQNMCGVITRDTVYVSVGTSIENAPTLQGVKVFPNPSQDEIHFQWNKALTKECELRIYNAVGMLILSQTIAEKESHYLLSLANLSTGMYFYQVSDGKAGKFSVIK